MLCIEVLRKKRHLIQLESVTFQTERVFLENHPDFASNWGLVEDEETETWLGRDRTAYALDSRSDVDVLLAEPSYLEAIAQLHHQTFSDEVEAPEVSHRYISEALKDPDSLLYILLKEGQVIGVCTVDVSGNAITFMDLRLLKSIVGKVTEAIWQNPSSTNSLSKMIRNFRLQWKISM